MRNHRLSILAVCLVASCAHQKAADTAHGEESRKVASAEPETPAQAEAREHAHHADATRDERVEVPSSKKRGEMASTGHELPSPKRKPDTPPSADTYGVAPDNTRVNERDRDSAALTLMDQGTSEKDIEITQRIRKDVISDDALSMAARNVKIITRNGHVTLRGTVKTRAERASIQQSAQDAAGNGNVTNEIEVAE